MKRFGRPAWAYTCFAAFSVLCVSYASLGETSSDTQPSTPLVSSCMGPNRSAARVRSSVEEFADAALGALNFAVYLVGGQIDKVRRGFGQDRLES